MKIIITQFNRSRHHCMCACIQLLFNSLMIIFIKKTYRQEYIAEDFNGNTIAVTRSRRVCRDPFMTRSPNTRTGRPCGYELMRSRTSFSGSQKVVLPIYLWPILGHRAIVDHVYVCRSAQGVNIYNINNIVV